MVATAQSLVRELAQRMGEFYLSTPTIGSTTTLIDANLDQYWPSNVGQQSSPMGVWVYGGTAAVASNRGVERRAKSYAQSTHEITFLAAWPVAITATTNSYEFHWRTPRSRKLEAINSGIRQLGFHWFRSVMDQASITTAVNTWSYDLPNTVAWGSIPQILIQINTDTNLTGYPYMDARAWNWSIVPFTSAAGVTTFRLQFASQPPPGRLLRIFAQANYADLVADADILPMDTSSAGIATEWLYSWGMYQLQRWESVRQPMNNTAWLEQQAAALLKEASDIRDRFASLPTITKITTPSDGTGQYPGGMGDDPSLLGVFQSGWL